jgi:hypothetical protein
MHRICWALLAAIILLLGLSAPAQAAGAEEITNKGLYITPIRQFITQDSGTTKQASITVGNFTDKPMQVHFSAKLFTVADYSYDYKFSDAVDNPIAFDTDNINLQPGDTRVMPYRITLPAESRPGGRYYTLFATGRGDNGTAPQQIQATSVVYLTVNGKLVQRSGLLNSSIDHFVFRPQIPYTLDVVNQGNVHYFAYLSATVRGIFGTGRNTQETHLLIPGTTRRFDTSVKTPFWPGIYWVTYGYRTEFEPPVSRVSRIVYLPPWSLAGAVLLAWAVWLVIHRIRHRRQGAAESGHSIETNIPEEPKD